MKIFEMFKKKPDREKEWMLNMIVALARLSLIKPEVLDRETKNVGLNKSYLIKLINGYK